MDTFTNLNPNTEKSTGNRDSIADTREKAHSVVRRIIEERGPITEPELINQARREINIGMAQSALMSMELSENSPIVRSEDGTYSSRSVE